jgi:hypothetical protein
MPRCPPKSYATRYRKYSTRTRLFLPYSFDKCFLLPAVWHWAWCVVSRMSKAGKSGPSLTWQPHGGTDKKQGSNAWGRSEPQQLYKRHVWCRGIWAGAQCQGTCVTHTHIHAHTHTRSWFHPQHQKQKRNRDDRLAISPNAWNDGVRQMVLFCYGLYLKCLQRLVCPIQQCPLVGLWGSSWIRGFQPGQ